MGAEIPDLALLSVNAFSSMTSLMRILTQMINYYEAFEKQLTVFLSGRKAMLYQGENNKTNGIKCIFVILKYFFGFKKK